MSVFTYDAINAFKASETGQGRRGTRQQRELASKALQKLWQLYGADDIGRRDLAPERMGYSAPSPLDDDIVTNDDLTLAETSVTLVHEAIHLVLWGRYTYVEHEVLARRAQLLYFSELVSGVTYQRINGASAVARMTQGSVLYSNLEVQEAANKRDQLVDCVLIMDGYNRSLDVAWVERRIRWWGGIANRRGYTKGIYVRVLGRPDGRRYADLVVEILDSVTPSQWPEVLRGCGGMPALERSVRGAWADDELAVKLVKILNRTNAPNLCLSNMQVFCQ